MRHYHIGTPYARLISVPGGYQFESTYDQSLVTHLKIRIPAHARSWDSTRKAWIVDAKYGGVCVELAEIYLGVRINVPKHLVPTATATRLVKLEYLGRCKDRGGESSAFGWADGGWTLVFPENILREWLEAVEQKPGEKLTLYQVLCVKKVATIDEIRAAYRRLARQWHPDVCHEADAAEQFKKIQHAYEILSDTLKRKKYDAGLALEVSTRTSAQYRASYNPNAGEYRSPLRCGWVMVQGKQAFRFVVEKILEWKDIVDAQGRVMVTSWPAGADHFEESWI